MQTISDGKSVLGMSIDLAILDPDLRWMEPQD